MVYRQSLQQFSGERQCALGPTDELADLLLHPLDRPFRVAEIGALLDAANLRLVSFIEPARYDPGSYLKDPRLLKEAAMLGSLEKAAFAEELAGNIKTHIFYVTAQARDTQARPEGPEMVPCLKTYDGGELAAACRRNLKLTVEFDDQDRAGVLGKAGGIDTGFDRGDRPRVDDFQRRRYEP